MNDNVKGRCPGCEGNRWAGSYLIPRQPVVLNYRYATAAAARRVGRRDLRLAECAECGLIFNSAFDAKAVPYDENYDNRQCFSAAFEKYLTGLAAGFIQRHHLEGQPALEVGCGKGDFLKLFGRLSGGPGAGYDTTYQGPATLEAGRLRFYRRHVSAADIRSPHGAVICRHVIEHVGPIGEFLRQLRGIAAAAGDPVVLLETPRFEWITENLAFWDIFHEHCNYFTMPCLARLCRQAGFKVLRSRSVFGGQYQALELKVRAADNRAAARTTRAAAAGLSSFARKAESRLKRLEEELEEGGAARGWAIWGAGAKGVALVSRLQRRPPRFVVDTNRDKQGGVIPGSAVPIVAPEDPRLPGLGVILIANPNYAAEIKPVLRRHGFTQTILTL